MESEPIWILQPSPNLVWNDDELRRAMPWLIGCILLAVGLWLLLQIGQDWPALASGRPLAVSFSLGVYCFGAFGLSTTGFAVYQVWVNAPLTCRLDKPRGLATLTRRSLFSWQPERQV